MGEVLSISFILQNLVQTYMEDSMKFTVTNLEIKLLI